MIRSRDSLCVCVFCFGFDVFAFNSLISLPPFLYSTLSLAFIPAIHSLTKFHSSPCMLTFCPKNVVEDWFNCCNDNRKGYCSGFCSGNKRKASKGLELNCDNAKSDKKAQCEKDNAQCRIKEDCENAGKVWTEGGIAPTSWLLPAGETDDYGGSAKYASRGECISQRNPDDKPKIHSRVWVYGGNYWGQNQWCPGE